MAWLTELQKDNISNHITNDVTVLSRRYKSKKKEFDEQSVEINEIEDWEKEDWEVTVSYTHLTLPPSDLV